MNRLIFATSNPNKLREAAHIVPPHIELVSLEAIQFKEEIPETRDTIEGNSLQKAQYVFDRTGLPVIAEDTGLMVDALDGAPGVYSARYAERAGSSLSNLELVLHQMQGINSRSARFKTIISLITENLELQFEGITEGWITESPRGAGGFGYDPIFNPENQLKTYAEMSMDEKSACSHRTRAFHLLSKYLKFNPL
jgi:XTP/dITP diphosphohydrolase